MYLASPRVIQLLFFQPIMMLSQDVIFPGVIHVEMACLAITSDLHVDLIH